MLFDPGQLYDERGHMRSQLKFLEQDGGDLEGDGPPALACGHAGMGEALLETKESFWHGRNVVPIDRPPRKIGFRPATGPGLANGTSLSRVATAGRHRFDIVDERGSWPRWQSTGMLTGSVCWYKLVSQDCETRRQGARDRGRVQRKTRRCSGLSAAKKC